jgi:hypothetical protein
MTCAMCLHLVSFLQLNFQFTLPPDLPSPEQGNLIVALTTKLQVSMTEPPAYVDNAPCNPTVSTAMCAGSFMSSSNGQHMANACWWHWDYQQSECFALPARPACRRS